MNKSDIIILVSTAAFLVAVLYGAHITMRSNSVNTKNKSRLYARHALIAQSKKKK